VRVFCGIGLAAFTSTSPTPSPPRSTDPSDELRWLCRDRGYVNKKVVEPKVTKEGKGQARTRAAKDMEEAELLNAHDDYANDFGVLGEIEFEPLDGDSSGGVGSMSFSDEQPEKLRDGSVDGSSVHAASKRMSSMSVDSLNIPSAFNLDDQSGRRSTSVASSRRSKLSILGSDPFDMDEESYNSLFADSSLREEPESHPSLLKNQSQQPLSQRIPGSAMLIAQKFAENLVEEDSSVSFLEIVNPQTKSKRSAARMFYSMLILVNEGVLEPKQEEPYGDIQIHGTALTQNYA
jgi:hypothetical protein